MARHRNTFSAPCIFSESETKKNVIKVNVHLVTQSIHGIRIQWATCPPKTIHNMIHFIRIPKKKKNSSNFTPIGISKRTNASTKTLIHAFAHSFRQPVRGVEMPSRFTANDMVYLVCRWVCASKASWRINDVARRRPEPTTYHSVSPQRRAAPPTITAHSFLAFGSFTCQATHKRKRKPLPPHPARVSWEDFSEILVSRA